MARERILVGPLTARAKRRPHARHRCGCGGFTLLEILAALGIAAVGIGAVVQAMGTNVSVTRQTEERLLATWVASNRLAEIRLSRMWPAARESQQEVILGGRSWQVREQVSATADPDIRRVDIGVHVDAETDHASATLFGYIARYTPAQRTPAGRGAENNDGA